MAKAYGAEGVVTKGGKPFTKQTIYKMLHNRMYLGEIVHKGQSFPGQHQAIVTQAQWDAVHALIATDGIERRRETNDRQSEPVLLRGLLFTSDGERLVPSYTKKKGKTYRYYSPIKHRRFGAWASSTARCQPCPSKNWSHSRSWQRCRHRTSCSRCGIGCGTFGPDLSEPEVVLPMRNLAGLWQQLFPAEQCRLAQLLIERVVIADGGLEIIWRDQGWQELAGELMPGTIGAELQEWEQTGGRWHEAESAGLGWPRCPRTPGRRPGQAVHLHPAEDQEARRQQGGGAAGWPGRVRRARSPARSTSPCWWR
jgi:site-specific DNA recombinase